MWPAKRDLLLGLQSPYRVVNQTVSYRRLAPGSSPASLPDMADLPCPRERAVWRSGWRLDVPLPAERTRPRPGRSAWPSPRRSHTRVPDRRPVSAGGAELGSASAPNAITSSAPRHRRRSRSVEAVGGRRRASTDPVAWPGGGAGRGSTRRPGAAADRSASRAARGHVLAVRLAGGPGSANVPDLGRRGGRQPEALVRRRDVAYANVLAVLGRLNSSSSAQFRTFSRSAS